MIYDLKAQARPEALTMPLVREANAPNEPNSDLKQGWPRADKAAGTAAAGTSRVKQSQFRDSRTRASQATSAAGGSSCKTNPISAGVSSLKFQVLSRRSQAARPWVFLLQNLGSSGFSVLVGCRPPSRGRCPRCSTHLGVVEPRFLMDSRTFHAMEVS